MNYEEKHPPVVFTFGEEGRKYYMGLKSEGNLIWDPSKVSIEMLEQCISVEKQLRKD